MLILIDDNRYVKSTSSDQCYQCSVLLRLDGAAEQCYFYNYDINNALMMTMITIILWT